MITSASSHAQAADYAEFVLPLTNQFFSAFFKLAAVQPGERVLDLACGPGETTIEAAMRAGPGGEVVGVDISGEFTALAQRRAVEAGLRTVRFETLDAGDLSALASSYWDLVICHLGIAEFADARAALAEMLRVLRPVGRAAFSTWGEALRSPWLAIPFDAVHAVLPARPAAVSARPFRYGEPGALSRLLSEAEYQDVTPDRVSASLEYESADQYWQTVERGLAYAGSPLAGLDPEQLARVRETAAPTLRRWQHPRSGRLHLPAQAFVCVAVK
ncbi:MAG TPA: class I SAM-dependent methyltransferase [Dehalococcoidia bacterium]|nr:class I SAM-dependent methyltransferase [Dehalococcoidia bacterium]